MLYITATPIGNLDDISKRALDILRSVDFVLCEDTRVTKKLLSHFEIKTPTVSYHEHSKLTKMDYIAGLLKQGNKLALVSDAGTPGISDPGNRLIQYLLSLIPDLNIVPIPGPNAAIAALSISGFPTDEFLFLGFPPHKKGREKFFKEIAEMRRVVVFYESPHRILKALEQLEKFLPPDRRLVVCRELTKMFETVYRGTVGDIRSKIPASAVRGEFVVVIDGKR
ncbi:MAG: 16S rRNA (cytidine(1402)-2'-O)-methyltransferase [Patescibacteria group bacterium]